MFSEELKAYPESIIANKDSKFVFEEKLKRQMAPATRQAIDGTKEAIKVLTFGFISSNIVIALVFAPLL